VAPPRAVHVVSVRRLAVTSWRRNDLDWPAVQVPSSTITPGEFQIGEFLFAPDLLPQRIRGFGC